MLLGYAFYYLNTNSFIITGYVAKKACSCALIAERSEESIRQQDLAMSPLTLSSFTVDKDKQRVTASLFGIWESIVQYVPGRGCVLLNDKTKHPTLYKHDPLFQSFEFEKDINTKVEKIIRKAFDENDEYIKKTRAMIVIHKDTILAERYAPGFNKETRILGWSMNKTIANALIGILVKNGELKIGQSKLFPSWEKDERTNITVDDLLRMRSGLDWDEIYTERTSVTRLLFEEANCASFSIERGLEAKPSTHWEYSSGTSNVLSGLIRSKFNNQDDYLKFPYDSLFAPLGMESMVLDTDQTGNYILSSYGTAYPIDWAKFGRLYLKDGIWQGKRILPEGWVDYTRKVTKQSDHQHYGAHVWVNAGLYNFPSVPPDMYSMNGFQGQYVFIIPSLDLIIVRMGLTEQHEFNLDPIIGEICDFVSNQLQTN